MTAPWVDGVGLLLSAEVVSDRPVGGGCISDARRVELADGRTVFAKSGAGLPPGLLVVEAEALAWLRAADAIAVPAVLSVGHPDRGEPDVLVLEWVEPGPPRDASAERLGRNLARLHAAGASGFGWHRDGYIGSLPQRNTPPLEPTGDAAATAWPSFWFTRRIEPLARQAIDGGALDPAAATLVSQLGERLPERCGPPEPPARLHGDLWSGNVMTDRAGEPWLVDPAPYGGQREVDLAMLHLFGAPAARTVAAYQESSPLAPGWRERLELWQLEPLLVHAVLFGGGYGAAAFDRVRRFA